MINEKGQLIITWQTEDVIVAAEIGNMPVPTYDQCVETLHLADRHHNACVGINWDMLRECLRIVQEGEPDD
jgi:hypothetical protein